jgi:hypothetical protein
MAPAYTGSEIDTNQWQGSIIGTTENEDEVFALLHESMGSSKYPDGNAFISGPAINFGRRC